MEDTAAARGPEAEPPAARRLRHYGLALMVLAMFLPWYGCHAAPGHFRDPPVATVRFGPDRPVVLPARSIAALVDPEVRGNHGEPDPVFQGTLNIGWFVFLPLPLWILGAWSARRHGLLLRRALGVLFWMVGLGALSLAAFAVFGGLGFATREAFTLAFGAWSTGLATLLARPRSRWGLVDLEASLSTHALCGLVIALVNPVWEFIAAVTDVPSDLIGILRALRINYKVGFWITLLGLILIVLPLYVPTRRFQSIWARLRARFRFLPAGLELKSDTGDG